MRENRPSRAVARESAEIAEIAQRHREKSVLSIAPDAGVKVYDEMEIWKAAALQAQTDRGKLLKFIEQRAARRNATLDRMADMVGQGIGVMQALCELLRKQELEALEDLPQDAQDCVRALGYAEAVEALSTACQAMVDAGASIGLTT